MLILRFLTLTLVKSCRPGLLIPLSGPQTSILEVNPRIPKSEHSIPKDYQYPGTHKAGTAPILPALLRSASSYVFGRTLRGGIAHKLHFEKPSQGKQTWALRSNQGRLNLQWSSTVYGMLGMQGPIGPQAHNENALQTPSCEEPKKPYIPRSRYLSPKPTIPLPTHNSPSTSLPAAGAPSPEPVAGVLCCSSWC